MRIFIKQLSDSFTLESLMKEIEERHEASRIYVDGGRTVREAVRKDLIQQLTITSVPLTLGSGISLLDQEDWDKLELVSSTKMTNGCVKKIFKPKQCFP